jgi:hypothetical protein
VSVVGGSSATALEPPFEYNGNALILVFLQLHCRRENWYLAASESISAFSHRSK